MASKYELDFYSCDPDCCDDSFLTIVKDGKVIYHSQENIKEYIEEWRKEIGALNLKFDLSAEYPYDWEGTYEE